MRKYAVIIESGRRNYSAYVPDLPGCVSTGKTRVQVLRNIQEAILFHIDGLREDGHPVPEPSCTCETVEV
jgi:predicted RNase H-like HicB family nuclease